MSFFSRLFSKGDTVYIEPDKYAHEPVPPCGMGNFYQHYYWKHEGGMACPACHALEKRKRELDEEERKNKALAKAIADEFEQRGLKL